MLFRPSRHLLRSRILRVAILIFIVWTLLEASYIHRNLSANEPLAPRRASTEKVFIAGLPWNNEIILRTHLINQIRDVVHALGISNVFISIYENGSYDGTKDALRDLHRELDELGVRTKFVLDETSHEDIVKARPTTPQEGWIKIQQTGFEKFDIHQGDYALRRIHYLAQLRNKALEPLVELGKKGEKFDRVLFLNDVVFSADDVLNLLQTKDGKYAAACSLDFESPPAFYDTFALRDSEGYPALMQTWPFFRSAASRDAAMVNDPVPVRSCWNGIVAMPASPFYSPTTRLRFRGVPDTLAAHHIEGSECCLIHADNPLSSSLGVWINPNVRVGYCHADLHKPEKAKFKLDWDVFKGLCQMNYDAVHPAGGDTWIGLMRVAVGLWENRLRRWVTWGEVVSRKVAREVGTWEREGHSEAGKMCLVDEMHVIEPHGWLHV
ncbi:uncharacterized protein LTR77_004807 [Saxophila tyrrhenica]|uniref:Glycosyltransferase family 69 protein n=1 Tax=Saxophila tyrrhenica TaxID=1690608 RepID=A0AAV9PB27_9PEZI|nr:hypothetical protein LTR77_004807 [Saxophila tyrrhenica]